MSIVAAVLAAAAVLVLMPARPRRLVLGPRTRSASLTGEARDRPPGRGRGATSASGRVAAAGPVSSGALGAGAVAWLLGLALPFVVLVAVVVGGLVRRRLRGSERPAAARARERAEDDLPLVADLIAACLAAGAAVPDAVLASAEAVGGTLAAPLRAAVARSALGADPVSAWQPVASDPVLRPIGQALARAARSGAPSAEVLTRVAEDCRREQAARLHERARRVGVQASLPVGLCFLPAFIVLGVVPAVIGLASTVIGS